MSRGAAGREEAVPAPGGLTLEETRARNGVPVAVEKCRVRGIVPTLEQEPEA